jgi:hypothetical protein
MALAEAAACCMVPCANATVWLLAAHTRQSVYVACGTNAFVAHRCILAVVEDRRACACISAGSRAGVAGEPAQPAQTESQRQRDLMSFLQD